MCYSARAQIGYYIEAAVRTIWMMLIIGIIYTTTTAHSIHTSRREIVYSRATASITQSHARHTHTHTHTHCDVPHAHIRSKHIAYTQTTYVWLLFSLLLL